ncbi:translocation/assembly module TamB [Aggregicoccus sp. 17bor-14]|uniref:translocation/assembly module TamB domain-containing protein n=1 Tax=Myxococcaceae TaxID=31 RepID=UPI00129C1F2E|nr:MULTISPECIES: translocation/assembly module TamB [Myxococcaceae]MBF5046179.1 translocation/assembly module TamB [Simulacricoccus sp. 17bor-14]MRI91904.1 translocation/assembly module TamB [Aggregicoccus sp. 17bor-14]
MSEPASTPPASPPARRHPWLRRLGLGLLGLVGLLLLLVAGGLVFLSHAPGERWLKKVALNAAGDALAGRLDFERLDLRGNGLTVYGLKLYDPEGELVAEIERVEADLSLRALASRSVDLTRVQILRPRLYLLQDERGLNLARAVAPRTPKPEEPATQSQLKLTLRGLTLEQGYVDLRMEPQSADANELHLRLEDLGAKGSAAYAAAKPAYEAALEAAARLTLPVQGPVKLSVKGSGEGEGAQGALSLQVAGAGVDAELAMQDPLHLSVQLKRLEAEPATVRAFLPTWPLQVPVTAQGTGAREGSKARLSLQVQAASARLSAEGSGDIDAQRADALHVTAQNVNLKELIEDGPVTSLFADLKAHGGGTRLDTLDGAVDLRVSPSRFRGQPLGPVELHASAKDGRYSVSELRALMPGVSLGGEGRGTQERFRFQGHLDAGNLALFADALARLSGNPALPLKGSGGLDFTLEGPLRHPGVKLQGSFASLGYGTTQLQGLTLRAQLPDVQRPLETDAALVVNQLKSGERTFKDLALTLVTQGRQLKATARAQGAADLGLQLAGLVDADGQGLAIQQLSVHYPEATWTSQGTSQLRFPTGLFSLTPLTLKSGAQRLLFEARLAGQRVDGRVEVEALDLARLPKVFVPPELGLAGTLDVRLRARGALPRPDAELSVKLEGGRFQRYQDLGLQLDARYVKDRASGTLRASAPPAQLASDFDVPVQALLRRRREPVHLKLQLERMDLARAMKALGRPEPLTGSLEASLLLEGLASDPRLDARIRALQLNLRQGTAATLPPADLELTAKSRAEDGALGVRLALLNVVQKGYVQLETPYTVSGLITRPPTVEAAMRTPIKLASEFIGLPLKLFAQPGASTARADGLASLRLEASGTPAAPVGRLDVMLDGATVRRQPPLDALLTVIAGEKDVKANLGVRRTQGHAPLVALAFGAKAPLSALMDVKRLPEVPLELAARTEPVALRDLPGMAVDPELANKTLGAVLGSELHFTGTLQAPKLSLDATLEKLGVGKLALGRGTVSYRYAQARSTLDARLQAPGGGSLQLQGTLGLDLSWAAMQKPMTVGAAPLTASLKAQNFDLAFLSGGVPGVTELAGILVADAKASGTVASPGFQGQLELSRGVLAYEGYTPLRELHLALQGNNERVEVKDLSARSGAGSVQLSALATRTGGSRFDITGKGKAQDFPIVYEDQLVGTLSTRLTLEGEATERLINLRNLAIPEAHLTLPELARKDLQPLARPEDVVVVRRGRPVNREQARKLKVLQGQLREAQGLKPMPEEAAEAVVKGPPARRIWITINAPRNLWVHGSDVNAEAGLSEDFRVEYTTESRIYGEVRLLRGQVTVLGRRFDVQRDSTVRFTGPAATPFLNVTAEHVVEQESPPITVFVTVRGQGTEVSFKPTSQPPLPETEIYTLLATGRRTLRRGSGASSSGSAQAASIVGSLLASQAKKVISDKLPLDVFSIEAGDKGLDLATLEVGKYIGTKVYIGYTGQFNADRTRGENANAVRFEYQFLPAWSFELGYGDAGSGGADIIWTKDY